MQGINAREVSLQYADPGICVCACLPENNPDKNINILHFTVIEEVPIPCMSQ